ncbi:MAG: MurR/RpiR family transcriptional regulator [Atopobiaceae bacterium]|nr:MurR/RpiR family transcriptional regulator [Atopobiaceae bacterium]MCH4181338.1 MurR/RpiR family transcriptional regulator [Atopobiaceae bacterium]MCH4213507.1 MurR/RpiR family transcriptional regulator [Atopobiaceae bacterium]MCH4276154.1 MurR/RpiR family transcriptional regulator [Atopobiaceae bacterium]MCI1227164.1 MurR/RpiR family transcriptional regulator [Atopobiaceae bacterium]
MDTMSTICQCYEKLSDAERKVADFILNNKEDVLHLSVREIADKSGASSASVSRFVRDAGFDSFATLRLALAREDVNEDGEQSVPSDGVSLDAIPESISYIVTNRVQELRTTASMLDEKSVLEAVKLLREADTVQFAAVGNSIPPCASFAFKLGQIGIRTVCPANTEQMVLASMSLTHKDVLVIVSTSGYSRRLETIVDNAEDNDAPIILLTCAVDSPLASRVDDLFLLATRDQSLSSRQFSSHMTATLVMDILFLLLFHGSSEALEHAKIEMKSLSDDKERSITLN